MIRIHKLVPMPSSLFEEQRAGFKEFIQRHNIEFVEAGRPCDFFMLDALPANWFSKSNQLKLLWRHPFRAKILIWTNEPRFSQLTEPRWQWSRWHPAAHVMNLYTGDVFLSNYSYSGWAIKGPLPHKELSQCPLPGQARLAGMMSYVANPQPWIIRGEDRDLNHLRMGLLLEGHRRGRLDIYGSGWPDGMALEDTRAGDWANSKLRTLENYDICLAMENTAFDHYCTEKIWQALAAGCLPIYYGKDNRIYDTFPRDSFLDAADFTNMGSLLDYIDQMPQQEYHQRYNRCIDTNNWVKENIDFAAERRKCFDVSFARFQAIADNWEAPLESWTVQS